MKIAVFGATGPTGHLLCRQALAQGHGPGRTLYADMRHMEEYLRACDDIDWTVMRPGRLTNDPGPTAYRLDLDFPPPGRRLTSRIDLASAMLAELGPGGHAHQAVYPTTR